MSTQLRIEKHINQSGPISFQDLDWELAAAIGLTPEEKTALTYVADVEGQTVYYMREMLSTPLARDSEVVTFMTIWNYEEYFHGHALNKLLCACGEPTTSDRREAVRMGAQFAARAEALVQWMLGRIMPRTFSALYLAWASSQEYLTRLAYERLGATTQNPVLKELCLRIAKQERRHFAWYFNSAKEQLAVSHRIQRVVRFVFEKFWSPVGVGVKSRAEARELVDCLFPGSLLHATMARVDDKMGELPGLAGIGFAGKYARELVGAPTCAPDLREPGLQRPDRSERPQRLDSAPKKRAMGAR